jgi:FlaA1/EpsC-like NDP-sugar epimerase
VKETRVLVVGAGSAGVMAVREMRGHPGSGYLPVAFIDDDPAKQGLLIEGVPVRGGSEAILPVLADTGAEEILIALPSVHGGVIRRIVELCRSQRVRFRIVPGIWEIIRGDVRIDHIRRIEPEDLLGRETVEADPALVAPVYRGRRVLVTGAGGSIGRELARQALGLGPERLVLMGRGENSLFESDLGLRRTAGENEVELALVDLRDREAVRRTLRRVKPHVVLHAAAHKHVTFMERYPEEAVINNVVATRDLIDACGDAGVERFVMLSTDKAVNPQSVMGASKRVAELLIGERTARGSSVRLMAVRFGNVLGSRGSVVPLFLHQIARGGPVTVAHPDTTRYFMTVKEAAMLVLEAGALGAGGEIFILDMGEQLNILDLARGLVTLSGLRPEADIPIVITGLKPGEKLREELVHDFEELVPTSVAKIGAARRRSGESPAVEAAIPELEALARVADREGIARVLERLVPEARFPGIDGSEGPSSAGGPSSTSRGAR